MTAVEAVVARLTACGLSGKIYNSLRSGRDEVSFRSLFVTGGAVDAWQVTREGTNAEDIGTYETRRTDMVVIYGYRSFADDVSEPTFQADVDIITAAFDPQEKRRFNNTFDWSGPLQVTGPKMMSFGNTLIHFCRMQYPVTYLPVS